MKRLFILFILLLSIGSGLLAQTVTLSFTGRGHGGINEEEIYQQIDSLQIRNVTRHWEQMIYYPDTVVIMDVLDVPMISIPQSGLGQNVPNPFDCVTEAELTLYESDAVNMSIIDANGREYASYSGNLPAGIHKFEITLAVPQAYFLTAVTSTGKYSVKMVNLGSCGTNRMNLVSSSDLQIGSKSLVENEFDLGDQMEYYAYTTYNNIVFNASEFREQTASEDITIHFYIPYCTRTLNVDYRFGCGSFTWINGETYTTTNHNAARMNLISAGGCDSIVLLDVTIDSAYQTEENITACGPITWNGINCSSSGDYIADLLSAGGCDSTVTLHFNKVNNINTHIYAEDCERYVWNNQIYTETGNYQQTFTSQYGCDSIVTLHFTNTSDYVIDTIVACEQFTWHGHVYYTSNYTDTVHLVNRYGCDSIVQLHLTMGYSYHDMVNVTSCMEYAYYGVTYRESGSYERNFTTVTGCDSIITLVLTIIEQVETDYYERSCGPFSYHGETFTETGNYDVHITTPVNCDSVVHLHLVVVENTYSTQEATACDSYRWFGQDYTNSGVYTHTLINAQGCDSIITLNLTVNYSKTNEKNIYACQQYDFNGERITETCVRTGIYTAANGCDSTVTYNINILDDVTYQFDQYACGSFTWNGTTYTTSGDHIQNFETFVGCDSTVTMHLHLGEPNLGIDDYATACDSYEWEGSTYTTSGVHTKTLRNIYGCDSVVTLHLTINPSYTMTDSRTECDSYVWEGDTYTTSGTYEKNLLSVNGCDSTVFLVLTINYSDSNEFSDTSCGVYEWDGRLYSASGDYPYTYTTSKGCDSVVTLHLVYHELVTDTRDGNTYCTMEYGNQVWMTENMRYLPQVNTNKSNDQPKYYVYGYRGTTVSQAKATDNYRDFGTLYNWTAAQSACPTGWHLPTNAEWDELVSYLDANGYSCGGSLHVAKSMASADNTWTSNSGNACNVGYDVSTNNSSLFNAKPGGYMNMSGSSLLDSNFIGKDSESNWWSATGSGTDAAYRYRISYNSASVESTTGKRHRGYYVRCVKDND